MKCCVFINYVLLVRFYCSHGCVYLCWPCSLYDWAHVRCNFKCFINTHLNFITFPVWALCSERKRTVQRLNNSWIHLCMCVCACMCVCVCVCVFVCVCSSDCPGTAHIQGVQCLCGGERKVHLWPWEAGCSSGRRRVSRPSLRHTCLSQVVSSMGFFIFIFIH